MLVILWFLFLYNFSLLNCFLCFCNCFNHFSLLGYFHYFIPLFFTSFLFILLLCYSLSSLYSLLVNYFWLCLLLNYFTRIILNLRLLHNNTLFHFTYDWWILWSLTLYWLFYWFYALLFLQCSLLLLYLRLNSRCAQNFLWFLLFQYWLLIDCSFRFRLYLLLLFWLNMRLFFNFNLLNWLL